MEIKEIEGIRIAADDVLVVVMDQWWSDHTVAVIGKRASDLGVKLFVLPPGTKVYAKEPEATDET